MPPGSGLSAQLGYGEEVYANEVQTLTITGGPTGGTFTLNFDGAVTAPIAFNAAAAAVDAVLEALANIGTAGVTCAGGPLPGTPVTITFDGLITKGQNQPLITASSAGLTGGTTPTAAVATTTPGTGYGDSVTPSRFLEFTPPESLVRVREYISSAGIRAGRRVERADRRIINDKGAGGSVTHEVADRGYGLLWKHAMGNVVISTPAGGTLTRDQTFILDAPEGLSLTVQKGVPRQAAGAGNVDAYTYTGGKITSFEIANAVDGLLLFTPTYDFQRERLDVALAAASYPANQRLLSFVGGQIAVGGANEDVMDFSLSVPRPMKTDRHYLRNSTLKKEPLENAFADIVGALATDYEGTPAYTRFVNGDVVALTALWEGAIIETTFKYGLLITMAAVQFTGETPQVGGPDVVGQPLPFKLLDNGVDPPLQLRYRTTDLTV